MLILSRHWYIYRYHEHDYYFSLDYIQGIKLICKYNNVYVSFYITLLLLCDGVEIGVSVAMYLLMGAWIHISYKSTSCPIKIVDGLHNFMKNKINV